MPTQPHRAAPTSVGSGKRPPLRNSSDLSDAWRSRGSVRPAIFFMCSGTSLQRHGEYTLHVKDMLATYHPTQNHYLACYEQCMAPLHYHRPYNRSWDINRLHCTMQWQQGALPTSLTPAGALEWLDDSNCHTHYVTWCNFRCGHAIDHVMDTCDACAVHLLHCMHSVTCNKRTLQRHSHHQFPNLFP